MQGGIMLFSCVCMGVGEVTLLVAGLITFFGYACDKVRLKNRK